MTTPSRDEASAADQSPAEPAADKPPTEPGDGSGSGQKRPRRRRPVPTPREGLWTGGFGELEVRRVQPYETTKQYVCPGCHRAIPGGTGHYVVVPALAPELRRHWHKACWERRERVRTPTR